jgi:hypothetical protein
VAAQVRRAIPYDGACFTAGDPESLGMSRLVLVDRAPEALRQVIELEYLTPDFTKYAELGRSPWPVGILSDATGGDLSRSARYREFLGPGGVTDEVRAACVTASRSWGTITLVRNGGGFEADEASLLARISARVGQGLRRSLLAPPSAPRP